jgi:hypothetical protein
VLRCDDDGMNAKGIAFSFMISHRVVRQR